MSYDINIRKDSKYSEIVSLTNIRDFIGKIPGVTVDDSIRLTFETEKEHYMEIYLAFFDAELREYLLDEERFVQQGAVNCVNIHIPYGCWSDVEKQPYLEVCVQIANQYSWEAYDLQYDRDIRRVYEMSNGK